MAALQAPLSSTVSQSMFRFISTDLVILSNYLILCHPLLLFSSVFFSISVFSSESVLHIRRPKDWSFSFSISPSNEYSGLISLRVDWFDLLAVQATLKSLLQHHSLKASILSIAFNSKQSTCYSSTFGDGIFCSPLNLFHKPSQ